MKALGITSTALLALLLAVAAAPAWSQEHEQEQKDKPAQQEEKKVQPQKSAKQEQKPAAQQEKNAKPAEKNAQQHAVHAQPKQVQQARGGRIPDDRFKANFGRQHTFRVSQGDYGNRRFQYGGYSFGFVGGWPSNWLYTQNVYVVEINGVYYLCNPVYPGVNIALSVVL
jgi:hypothetical protein